MRTKRFKPSQDLHGSMQGPMHLYFNAIGDTQISKNVVSSSLPLTPIGPTASALSSNIGPSTTNPISTGAITSPNLGSTTATPTPTGAEAAPTSTTSSPISSPITTATTNPITASTVTGLPMQLTQPTLQILTSASRIDVSSTNGSSLSTPRPNPILGGGGFGGGGIAEPEQKGMEAFTKKKSNLFPWLLIATGVFILVKKPFK